MIAASMRRISLDRVNLAPSRFSSLLQMIRSGLIRRCRSHGDASRHHTASQRPEHLCASHVGDYSMIGWGENGLDDNRPVRWAERSTQMRCRAIMSGWFIVGMAIALLGGLVHPAFFAVVFGLQVLTSLALHKVRCPRCRHPVLRRGPAVLARPWPPKTCPQCKHPSARSWSPK